MKFEILTVPSFWKTDMKQKYYQLYEENNKLVVLFPEKTILVISHVCILLELPQSKVVSIYWYLNMDIKQRERIWI